MEFVTYCLHQEHILLFGDLDQGFQLRSIGRERLLAEHILASFEAESRILVMMAVRGCNVNDVNIGILDEFLVGSVCLCALRSANFLEEVLSALCR